MSVENNICESCPAAYALGIYTRKAKGQEGTFLIEARRNEAKKARCALEKAAGHTACKSINKELPALPDSVPPIGTDELIEFVSQCPSFLKYLELRQAEIG